jgi:hypothetical protein
MLISSNDPAGAVRAGPDKGRGQDESVQHVLSGILAVPQRPMLTNIETTKHAAGFLVPRMQANAAWWSSPGHFGDARAMAEADRAYGETAARDCVAEMTARTDLARKTAAQEPCLGLRRRSQRAMARARGEPVIVTPGASTTFP